MSNLSQISKYSEKHKYFTTDCGRKTLQVIKNILLHEPIICLIGPYSMLEYFYLYPGIFRLLFPTNFKE